MSESLFTTQTPVLTDVNEATAVNVAITITFATAGTVSGGRFFAPLTVSGTYVLALYQVTANDTAAGAGTLLGTATFGSITAGAWNSVSFSSPIAVSTGVAYRIDLRTSAGRYAATQFFFQTSALTNGNITGILDGSNPVGLGTLNNGTFAAGTAYPGGSGQNFRSSCYFVDVVFDATSSTVNGAATLGSTSSLTAAANVIRQGSASLSSTSSLTATAAVVRQGAATLTSTSSLNAAGTVVISGSAALVSTSALTANASGTQSGQATLASTGSLTGSATVLVNGAATLASTSSLTGSTSGTVPGSATLASTSTLTAAGAVVRAGTATLTSTSSLAGSANRLLPGTASLASTSVLTGQPALIIPGTAGLASVSALSAYVGTFNQPGLLTASMATAGQATAESTARLVSALWP